MTVSTTKKSSRIRRILWFIGLYFASLIVVGAVTMGLRLLVGLPV